MKRKAPLVSSIVAALAVGMSSLSGFLGLEWDQMHLDGSVGYESRFVYRGSELAKDNLVPKLELQFPLFCTSICDYCYDFEFYVGGWGIMVTRNTENITAQQANPYAGIITQVNGCLSFDMGYIRYIYTNTDEDGRDFRNRHTSRQNEIYFGIMANMMFNPAIYTFYNFDLEQWVFEGSANFDFNPFCIFGCNYACIFEGISVNIDARMGYLTANEFNGNQRAYGVAAQRHDYVYAKVQADIIFNLTDCICISGGPRVAWNNDNTLIGDPIDGPFYANTLTGDKAVAWWGGCIRYTF